MLLEITEQEFKLIDELRRTKHYENDYVLYDDYAEMILRTQKGKEKYRAKVSLEDIEKLKTINWYCSGNNYVAGHTDQRILHRFILDVPKYILVDHINRDRFDCRRENLRACTAQENCFNKSQMGNNASGHIGVNKIKNKWRAYISVNKKQISLGYFDLFEDAVKARIEGEKKYFGEFAPIR